MLISSNNKIKQYLIFNYEILKSNSSLVCIENLVYNNELTFNKT